MMKAKEFYLNNKGKIFLDPYNHSAEYYKPIGYNLSADFLICEIYIINNNSLIPLIDNTTNTSSIKEKYDISSRDVFIEEESKNLNSVIKEIEDCQFLTQLIHSPIDNNWYISFFQMFYKLSIETRKSHELNLTPYIKFKEDCGVKFSVIIDQDKNQKDTSMFYLYLNLDGEQTFGIFDVNDTLKILLDILSYKDYSELVALSQILKAKDKYIFDQFIKDEKNLPLIKESLAYYSIGLNENKMTETDNYKKINNLFLQLNEVIYLNEKGEIKFKKEI